MPLYGRLSFICEDGVSRWDRLYVSACAGLLAYMAAYDLGVPAWRYDPPGDATDFGVVTFMLVTTLQKRAREAA